MSLTQKTISELLDIHFGKFTKMYNELSSKGYKIPDTAMKLDCDEYLKRMTNFAKFSKICNELSSKGYKIPDTATKLPKNRFVP